MLPGCAVSGTGGEPATLQMSLQPDKSSRAALHSDGPDRSLGLICDGVARLPDVGMTLTDAEPQTFNRETSIQP